MYRIETKDVRRFFGVILTEDFFGVFVHLRTDFFDKMF